MNLIELRGHAGQGTVVAGRPVQFHGINSPSLCSCEPAKGFDAYRRVNHQIELGFMGSRRDADSQVSVTNVLVDLDQTWVEVGSDTSVTAIDAILNQARVGLAEFGLSELRAATQRILSPEPSLTEAQEADAIEASLSSAICNTLRLLISMKELEASVLASRSVQF